MTRIVRGRINANNEWVDQQDIFQAPDALYTSTIIHYGSRFLFDGKGHLFWTVGERGDMTNAQNLSTPLGKVHRINVDGSVPKDNLRQSAGAIPPSGVMATAIRKGFPSIRAPAFCGKASTVRPAATRSTS